jgi:hypothetical protein
MAAQVVSVVLVETVAVVPLETRLPRMAEQAAPEVTVASAASAV